MNLSQAQLAASVDAASYKDGIKQSSGAWTNIGTDGVRAWGAIQGSANAPYFVCIDLEDTSLPAKCTCPSRKFPCKHAVGLALKAIADIDQFPQGDTPEAVKMWIVNRQKRATSSEPAPEAPAASEKAKSAKVAAKQKTVDARLAKVAAGMADLRLRLRDIARQGLTDPRLNGYAFWDEIAKRMVDAQAGGVATRLRSLGGMAALRTKVQTDASPLLDEIARLYLLADSYERIDALPPDMQADIRALIGFSVKQDEVIAAGEGVRDTWLVMGQSLDTSDSLLTRIIWLFGMTTRNWAAIIDFKPQFGRGVVRFDDVYLTGETFNAELVYYPGAFPQRALIKARASMSSLALPDEQMRSCFVHLTMEDALYDYADALKRNPFLERFPIALQRASLTRVGERTLLCDDRGVLIAPTMGRLREMVLLAAGGGATFPIFGEWNGYTFRSLMLYADGVIFSLE
ncbi:MAG: SWIM zinc finger family protein [Chloroflexota bacterium]|nr:SWIM zinc finger family protein [Chloroflexota bacterium]